MAVKVVNSSFVLLNTALGTVSNLVIWWHFNKAQN